MSFFSAATDPLLKDDEGRWWSGRGEKVRREKWYNGEEETERGNLECKAQREKAEKR